MKGTDQVFAVIITTIHSPTVLITVRNVRDMSYRFGVNALKYEQVAKL